MTAAQPPLRLGIIGIGVGATQILPMIEAAPEIELVAFDLGNVLCTVDEATPARKLAELSGRASHQAGCL